MNEQERFDRELSGWMRDQVPGRAPGHLVPMTMTSIHATQQSQSSWMASPISWFAVTALGLAGAVALVVVAFAVLRGPAPVASVPSVASTSSVRPTESASLTSAPPDLPSFTTGQSADSNATWTKLSWRKLDADDPLASIRAVVRLSGGYGAIGSYDVLRGGTPLWTSMDGAHFRQTSFVRSAIVLDVVELKGLLIALAADPGHADCPVLEPCLGNLENVRALTSVDRINWHQGSLPDLAATGPINSEPVMAVGPSGLLVATPNGPVVAALSSDGLSWSLASDSFPAGFEMAGAWGRPDGYAAVGTLTFGTSQKPQYKGLALWSSDGRSWSSSSIDALGARYDIVLAASDPGELSSLSELVAGRDGAIAIGHAGGTPGISVWWQSTDGRSWGKVADFRPLGPALRDDGSSFGVPDGRVASDGSRMVALRRDDRSAGWTSFDGSTWTPLGFDGQLPQDGDLLVLPNGVLLFDGESSWFGEATGR